MKQITVIITFLFGVVAIGCGIYRPFILGDEGGTNGLYFGLVMGGLALFAAALMAFGKVGIGKGIAFVVFLFVAGWFGYEIFVKKGISESDARMFTIFLAAILEGIVLIVSCTNCCKPKLDPENVEVDLNRE